MRVIGNRHLFKGEIPLSKMDEWCGGVYSPAGNDILICCSPSCHGFGKAEQADELLNPVDCTILYFPVGRRIRR